MKRKIGIILLCTVMAGVLALFFDRLNDTRLIIDLAIIIACGTAGFYILRAKKKEKTKSDGRKITKRIAVGFLTLIAVIILSAVYFDVIRTGRDQIRMDGERKKFVRRLELEQETEEKKGQAFLDYWEKPYPLEHQEWGNDDFDLKWKFTDQTKKNGEIYVACEWTIQTHLKDRGNLTFYTRPIIQLLDEYETVIASDTDEYTTTARSQIYSGEFKVKKKDALRVCKTGVKWRHH